MFICVEKNDKSTPSRNSKNRSRLLKLFQFEEILLYYGFDGFGMRSVCLLFVFVVWFKSSWIVLKYILYQLFSLYTLDQNCKQKYFYHSLFIST